MQSTSLLRLLHLVSPALPIGAFAYSKGLESAVELEWITDVSSCEDWLVTQMEEGMGRLDLPIFIRLYNLWQQRKEQETDDLDNQLLSKTHYWAQYLLACRESRELHLEEQQLGKTMVRLLESLDFKGDFAQFHYSYTCQFSFACVQWGIPLEDAVNGFIWSWLENQVTAASKIIPLGQTDAQKMLVKIVDLIPAATETAFGIEDIDIGSNLAALAIASQIHEDQYSRLFRS
ncbi:MAG: urease accessory protein UreF [Pseudomonadales bacterium]|nr:urease accessory protein UreF [Pseudomonadales bacterium]